MTATDTKATAPKAEAKGPSVNKDGKPRKAPEKGVVTANIVPVEGELPKFKRGGYSRRSAIDETLDEVRKSVKVNQWVQIRQYSKKESASGTLYNLRDKHKDSGEWEFNIGPVDNDMTGLFARRVK